ncbi:DUF4281 domain-containing protein [Acidovorax sp. SUPP1855]|uniref:ABA4-like family protein n=1 Tax=Acidovorax sp. SUPP1855 TaxID=431774 RepID=UPI0023DE1E72|nr:ABA4-like family protein [Acidovorax sp. SUPP1855]GKS84722.1 DUF4281 domain-containing protein [Acidovorax sp. SUPP1855]
MTLDSIFSISSGLALLGWMVLVVSPVMPRWSNRLAAWVIPSLLATLYTALMLAHFAAAQGGFSSLDDVARLFASRPVLLAGWLHYLAFDLAIGAWEVRDARRRSVRFWLVLPCLAATFLFGPAGFLLYLIVRSTAPRRQTEAG